MTTTAPEQAPQPAAEHVITALTEELRRLNDNRWYLLSLLAQKDADLAQKSAQISQLTSEVEQSRTSDS
jgi:hypothetical protein